MRASKHLSSDGEIKIRACVDRTQPQPRIFTRNRTQKRPKTRWIQGYSSRRVTFRASLLTSFGGSEPLTGTESGATLLFCSLFKLSCCSVSRYVRPWSEIERNHSIERAAKNSEMKLGVHALIPHSLGFRKRAMLR